ncbi:MAG TPA: hypothetical protein VFB37_01820 [Steroidobacteraceae bacterium]|nr:hypothetical protein [Steroidobacteraceae bacterium]
MSFPDSADPASFDERLSRAFAGLDVSSDFDALLTARLARESEQDFAQRLHLARQLELERYRNARFHASWRQEARALLRLLTSETAGVAVLIVLVGSAVWGPLAAWANVQWPGLSDALHQNAAIVWPSLLGVLFGLAPLLARRLRDLRAD